MTKVKEPRPGEKLTSQEAKTYVDYLYVKMYESWKQKIHNGPFMTQLRDGKLPMPVILRGERLECPFLLHSPPFFRASL